MGHGDEWGHRDHWQGWVGPDWGPGSGSGHGRSRSRGGPPPWVAGLLGWGQQAARPAGGGPRVRRGDVRVAILDVVRAAAEKDEPVNGYQVIQQIAERSNGTWRPSPGSVYPTIQQLHDEGLVESDDERGRKTIRLTEEGRRYVEGNAAELEAVWEPFEVAERYRRREQEGSADLKSEIGQVMSALWQIVSQGSDAQRRALGDVLVDTRRSLYGILADGADGGDGSERDRGTEGA